MKTIWKWTLSPTCELEIPEGAKLLAVQEQFGAAQLWALVDPDKPKRRRDFVVYGTGHKIENNFDGKYIGTFQVNGGSLVFHVFETTISQQAV